MAGRGKGETASATVRCLCDLCGWVDLDGDGLLPGIHRHTRRPGHHVSFVVIPSNRTPKRRTTHDRDDDR